MPLLLITHTNPQTDRQIDIVAYRILLQFCWTGLKTLLSQSNTLFFVITKTHKQTDRQTDRHSGIHNPAPALLDRSKITSFQ